MSKFRQYDKYEIYENGRIWSYKKNKFLKYQTNKGGYQRVGLYDNEGKQKWYYVHKVVWESVTGSPIPEGLQVNHIDERKDNNARSNLNLLSPKQNVNWGSGIERCAKARTNGKLSKQVGAFNKDGELVMVFPSIMEAQRQGFNRGNVYSCCRGERKTHKGYTWRYI